MRQFFFLWVIALLAARSSGTGMAPDSVSDVIGTFSESVGSNAFTTMTLFRGDGTFQDLYAHAQLSGRGEVHPDTTGGTYSYERIDASSGRLTITRSSGPASFVMKFQTDTTGTYKGFSPSSFDLWNPVSERALMNLSNRAWVSPGRPAISGLVISGGTRWVLIRVVGPTLATFGVPAVVKNPQLGVFQDPYKISEYKAWSASPYTRDALKRVFALTGAFSFPDDSADVAVLLELSPGAYTLHSSSDTETGETLTEVYVLPFLNSGRN